MVKYPDSTNTSLEERVHARARERWPDLARVEVRHRANFRYVNGVLADGTTLKLCRLHYSRSGMATREGAASPAGTSLARQPGP